MALVATIINIFLWSRWTYSASKVFFVRNSYNSFLQISAFLFPFYSASFAISGFQISFYKIMPIFLLLSFMLSKEKLNPKILIISVYFILITGISYFYAFSSSLFNEVIVLGRNESSAYFGPLIQGMLFLFAILQFWFVRKNEQIDHIKILSCYIYGCLLLVIIGYIQIFAYATNLPWFDYWFLHDALGRGEEESLATLANDRGFYRMSSLSGEPRHFSALLALSLMLKLYIQDTNRDFRYITGKNSIFTSIFIFSGFLLTISSSGLLSIMIGFGTFLLFTRPMRFILFSFLSFLVLLLFSEYTLIGNLLWKLSSIDMILYAVKKDAFALYAITNDWLHFFIGYGTNLADLYVKEYYLMQDSPFGGTFNRYLLESKPMEAIIAPTSAILQILINGGLIGFFLVFLLMYGDIRHCRKKTIFLMISILAMSLSASTIIFPLSIIFFALIASYEKEYR